MRNLVFQQQYLWQGKHWVAERWGVPETPCLNASWFALRINTIQVGHYTNALEMAADSGRALVQKAAGSSTQRPAHMCHRMSRLMHRPNSAFKLQVSQQQRQKSKPLCLNLVRHRLRHPPGPWTFSSLSASTHFRHEATLHSSS
jgi:hypothetical protein